MVSVRKSYRTSMVVMSLTNAPAEGVGGGRGRGEEGRGGGVSFSLLYVLKSLINFNLNLNGVVRRKFWKEPQSNAKILFCGRA